MYYFFVPLEPPNRPPESPQGPPKAPQSPRDEQDGFVQTFNSLGKSLLSYKPSVLEENLLPYKPSTLEEQASFLTILEEKPQGFVGPLSRIEGL